MPSARRWHFCILLLPDKSMASGGTRPAGFVFQKKHKDNRSIGTVHKVSYRCSRLVQPPVTLKFHRNSTDQERKTPFASLRGVLTIWAGRSESVLFYLALTVGHSRYLGATQMMTLTRKNDCVRTWVIRT